MKKIALVFIAAATIQACSSTQSLQEYYVDNAENPNFLSFDVPASLMNLEKIEMSETQKEALRSLKKLNILAFRKTEINGAEYKVEKEHVNAILKNSKYTELMKMNTEFGKATVKFLGDDDAIDEVMLRLLNSPRMHATQLELDVAFHSSAAEPHAAALASLFGVDGLDHVEDIGDRVLDAWTRGARIFVDVGPRAGFSHWIPRILEGKPHEVIALDPTMQGPPALVDALVRLAAVGRDVSLAALKPLMCPVEPSHRLPDLGWQDTRLACDVQL